jgi:hypothetical protein
MVEFLQEGVEEFENLIAGERELIGGGGDLLEEGEDGFLALLEATVGGWG